MEYTEQSGYRQKRRKFPKDSFPNYVYALVTLSYSEKDYQLQPANNFHVKTNTSI